jgi:hypothetical protein
MKHKFLQQQNQHAWQSSNRVLYSLRWSVFYCWCLEPLQFYAGAFVEFVHHCQLCWEEGFFLSQEEEIRRNQMKLEMISHLHASTTITGGYECWNALSNNVLHCAWELCWAPSGEGRTQSLILIAEPSAGRANQRVANRAHWSVWIIKYYWNLLNIVEYHGILNMAQNSWILNIDCGKHCLSFTYHCYWLWH